MKKKKRNIRLDILFVLISSFIVVVAWVSFNLYHIWVTSTVGEEIQMQLTPIDPQFDPTTIQQLRTREQVNPLFDKQTSTIKGADSTTPTPTTGPILNPPGSASDSSRLAPTGAAVNGLQGQ